MCGLCTEELATLLGEGEETLPEMSLGAQSSLEQGGGKGRGILSSWQWAGQLRLGEAEELGQGIWRENRLDNHEGETGTLGCSS